MANTNREKERKKNETTHFSFSFFLTHSFCFGFFSPYLCQNSLVLIGIKFFFSTFNMMDKMRHVYYIATGILLRKVTILSGIIIKGNPNTFIHNSQTSEQINGNIIQKMENITTSSQPLAA